MSRDSRFAAVIPVGPYPIDVARGVALIESLLFWEPMLALCVVLDDARGTRERRIARHVHFPPTCRVVTLLMSSAGAGERLWGPLVAAIVTALSWLQSHTDVGFVLKIDTDALVINSFAEAVSTFLSHNPDAGVVGAMGLSCNPSVRCRENYNRESRLLLALRTLPIDATLVTPEELERFPGPGRLTRAGVQAFAELRSHVQAAAGNGYGSLEYCQGGAYAISRLMIDRMAIAGYLERPEFWINLPFGEDTTMGMYARATGLHVRDCSADGQPFGVQCSGLAYSPSELVRRGYSIIHSVKNDPRMSEADIRAFFRQRVSNLVSGDKRLLAQKGGAMPAHDPIANPREDC